MRATRLAFLAVMVISVVIGAALYRRGERGLADSQSAMESEIGGVIDEAGPPGGSGDLPIVPSDYDWSAADEAELRGLVDEMESETDPGGFTFDLAIGEGESLLTEALEIRPGVFNFTRLTPRRGEVEGNPAVVIETERLSVDVSGNVETPGNSEVVVPLGSLALLSVYGEEDVHHLSLHAESLADGLSYRIRGTESVEPHGDEAASVLSAPAEPSP